MKKQINEFVKSLELRNASAATIKLYSQSLERFRHTAHIKSPLEITPSKVVLFQDKLRKEGMSHNSVATILTVVRSFLKFLNRNGYATMNPEQVELPKVVRTLKDKVISLDDLKIILDLARDNKLHYAIIMVLASTGVRVSELCSLQREDLDNVTVQGKGDKSRLVFLSASAKEAVSAYLSTREDTAQHMFAVPGSNSPIHPRYVQKILSKYAKKTGVAIHPHSLRHLFASELLRNGCDLRSIQDMLGHASIATTMIYTTVTNEKLKADHEKYLKI